MTQQVTGNNLPVSITVAKRIGDRHREDKPCSAHRIRPTNKNTIVEFHAVIETENTEFWVPIEALRQLKPDLIFFINASPADVLYRRMHDKSKFRKIISEVEILNLQTMALLHLTKAYSSDRLQVVSNSDAFKLISEAINKGKQ
ncbi:hypothetical protein HBN92_15700 [Pseudomonas fragi]|uniref:AAA family ATPase n=1 Tax=Pseudomonas fragi TaxID=296 RepID=UPI001472A3F6|nr:AAA family ATPase [Pseudomonas fragi]NNB26085.1 hypothetical protein [Pseudomonas fragi]